MIGFWNRKEVYVGHSMNKFSNIRSILVANNIRYTYKTINHNNSEFPGMGRGVKGSFGERSEFSYMYYIYVHRNDYEHAYKLIQGN